MQEGKDASVLTPKDVAALEPLLPPRVTDLWQTMLSAVPRKDLRMGARISDLVYHSDIFNSCVP